MAEEEMAMVDQELFGEQDMEVEADIEVDANDNWVYLAGAPAGAEVSLFFRHGQGHICHGKVQPGCSFCPESLESQ